MNDTDIEEQSENASEKPAEHKGWESVVLRILKWLAIIGVILFIIFTVLSRLGGNSEVLRTTIEDFLTEATPYSARVGTLNSMRFFPNIVIDVADVDLRGGGNVTGESIIRIGAARIVMSFFDVMFRPGHFKDIELQNINALSGSLLNQPVSLDFLSVQDHEDRSAIVLSGKLAGTAFSGFIGLHTKGRPGRYTYVIGRERPFEINLGDLKAQGTIRNTMTGDYKFENVALVNGETEVARGNIDFDRAGDHQLKIGGQLRLEPGKSRLDTDFVWDHSGEVPLLSGQITSPELTLSDLAADAPASKALKALTKIFGEANKTLDLSGQALDIKLDLQKVSAGKLQLGTIKTPLSLKDSKLHIGPLSGQIIGGALSGDITLDGAESPAKLNPKIMVKAFDYTALQKQLSEKDAAIEGRGDILIDLSSKGTNVDALIDNLAGKAGFVGGQGKMRAGLLDVWGGGLLNAMLPSFEEQSDVNMNCVVLNLDIKNGIGHSDSVFVDTKRVTLHGEGTYDFNKDHLEMVLEPKPKDVSIGDISAAVNVSGPLDDLSASPNAFDLGKKVGGLLLGAVNPVFYAVTLADLGLSDDHPCKAYVIEKEVLPEPEKAPDAAPEQEEPAPETPVQQPELEQPVELNQ